MLFRSNDTATTEIYTLSLHDALPIYEKRLADIADVILTQRPALRRLAGVWELLSCCGL